MAGDEECYFEPDWGEDEVRGEHDWCVSPAGTEGGAPSGGATEPVPLNKGTGTSAEDGQAAGVDGQGARGDGWHHDGSWDARDGVGQGSQGNEADCISDGDSGGEPPSLSFDSGTDRPFWPLRAPGWTFRGLNGELIPVPGDEPLSVADAHIQLARATGVAQYRIQLVDADGVVVRAGEQPPAHGAVITVVISRP